VAKAKEESVGKAVPEAPILDLSKISNVPSSEKKKRKGKFSFTEAETTPLPSRGILYSNITDDPDILNGQIQLYPMTVKDEEILSTSRFLKTGAATRMVIDNCLASNIDAKDILLYDSNYLLFFLRGISYGDDYKFKLKCSNSTCNMEFDHTVKISDLDFEELPAEVKEPFVVTLPKCKYKVTFVLPRLAHSEEIYNRNRKRKKSTEDADQRLVDNLIVTTIRITAPDGEDVSPADWEEFYESLIGMDRATLKDEADFSTGVDKLEGVVCPYCENDYSGTIPIGVDFFRF
jgi:hypothetical protein